MRSNKSGYSLTIFIAVLMVLAGFGFNMDLNGEVTGVKVTVSPSNHNGKCPKVFTFTGKISIVPSGSLRYRWIRSDGGTGPVKGGPIVRGGIKTVTTTWTLGATGNSYKSYWMAIQILPSSYSINTNYRSVRPLMTSNKAYFNLNCLDTLAVNPELGTAQKRYTQLRFMLPQYEISGRISPKPEGCRGCLQGRKITIVLRKEGGSGTPVRITRHTFTLGSDSSYNYKFKSPFITAGTYMITVEKGPTATSPHSNDLNICFRGADPVRRSVTLTSSQKKALNQDFGIDYTIQWGGGQPLCW